MSNFESFGLSELLLRALARMNYTKPTEIQSKTIPLALSGRDILGSAQTGTGKTAAFAIPLVEMFHRSPEKSAIIVTPTRELARQVLDVVKKIIGDGTNIQTAFLIGGEQMERQCKHLRQRPRLIVGTPGRINDHLKRGTLKLHDTGFLVLDEMDQMLDMGFSAQIEKIVHHLPSERQTLMFSATMPENMVKLARKYMKNPERVAVGSVSAPTRNIKQEVVHVKDGEKYSELVRQLETRGGSILVFVKTKYNTEKLAKRLNKEKFDTNAIHGNLRQNRRDRVIKGFRNKEYRILIATDIAARGLDIPHIEHVINYDLPQAPEDYIHRIGRTARAGAIGSALCLLTPQDGRKWHAIEKLMKRGEHSKAR